MLNGNLRHAQKCFEQALTIFRGSGDRFYFAIASYHLAEVYEAMGKTDNAKKLFDQALKIMQEIGGHAEVSSVSGQENTHRLKLSGELTPLLLQESIVPYLTALSDLQKIINELQNKPTSMLRIQNISFDDNSEIVPGLKSGKANMGIGLFIPDGIPIDASTKNISNKSPHTFQEKKE